MNNFKPRLQIGDMVTIRPDFGLGAQISVKITGFDEETGRDVIDYVRRDGVTKWAYTTQIVAEHGAAS